MKTILVATDFSVPAENAAHFAIGIAKEISANVLLCNTYKVPDDAPMAVQVAWPLVSEEEIEQESDHKLIQLIEKLNHKDCDGNSFCPQVTFKSEKGEVCQVIQELAHQKDVELVVMGMAGAGQLIQWALGSNSKRMIDVAEFPVLYVPSVATFKGIRKIAFASSLSGDELEPLKFLCRLAEPMEAEVIIYHITSSEQKRTEEMEGADTDFYQNVIRKLTYKKLRYENIWHSDIYKGLKWIRNNDEVDIISMVHHHHHLVDRLVNGSYAHKLSRFTRIPLLIFPHQ
ncbi:MULTISPECIES: universal stress protein [Pedobacter]|uniref:Nucleotide-binding universal stress UspA family protein n=1 Tax=Pedobacter zeae TaxID=1737356 RepID=A0A7W6KDU3_9SPHI|nr:universal stress protein [Pedobacter zeae]MBB4109963.1 nucleotide-binding universal stress UspA family protein [Pedobacter zeae]GGH15220.1 hypothetical protein GCM10007422_37120 [Pedobacter zeae]